MSWSPKQGRLDVSMPRVNSGSQVVELADKPREGSSECVTDFPNVQEGQGSVATLIGGNEGLMPPEGFGNVTLSHSRPMSGVREELDEQVVVAVAPFLALVGVGRSGHDADGMSAFRIAENRLSSEPEPKEVGVT